MNKLRLPFQQYSDYPGSNDLNQQFEHFIKIAKDELGFPRLAIASIDKMPFSSPSFTSFSNMPEQWIQDYKTHNLALVDPLLAHSLSSSSRLVWDESTLQQSPMFAEFAKKHGQNAGIYQSFRDVFGITHVVVLARTEPISAKEIADKELQISHFMHTVQTVLEEFFSNQKAAEYNVLSDRELEVLRWAASGKTAVETASILKVSERTVNFHLNNCAEKLNVRTKSQAILKAIALNIL